MKIALTGASGFVGSELQKKFQNCIVISRNDTQESIVKKLDGVDVVINLAGAPIMKRWSESYKKVLLESRIESTKKLVNAVNQSDVKQFISTSAVGIYPDNSVCDEDCDDISKDFLGSLAYLWEQTALTCKKPTAILRFGVVLGKEGGALKQMLLPFSLGLGGNIGDGRMMMSWISMNDLMRMYEYIIDKKLTGIFNAVSPESVSNAQFTKALGVVLHRPTFLPFPKFMLKLIFSEGAVVLTGSKEVYPKALLNAGFEFEDASLSGALESILKKGEKHV